MSITQTVDIPDSRRLTIDVPFEIPTGPVILTFTPAKSNQMPEDHRTNDSQSEEKPVRVPGFGCAKGKIWMADDFDAPLEDFKDYM